MTDVLAGCRGEDGLHQYTEVKSVSHSLGPPRSHLIGSYLGLSHQIHCSNSNFKFINFRWPCLIDHYFAFRLSLSFHKRTLEQHRTNVLPNTSS